jgi:hypothetical protein
MSKHNHAYPKVAADPIMYWPSVRSIPLGPGPKRTMLVNPTIVRREHFPRMFGMARTEDEADDQSDSCQKVSSCNPRAAMKRTSTHHATHLHYALLAIARRMQIQSPTLV